MGRSIARSIGLAVALAIAVQATARGGTAQPFRFCVVGGTQGTEPARAQVVAQMIELRPDLVLHAGGAVWSNPRPADWQALLDVLAPLQRLCPIYPCHGAPEGRDGLFGGRFRMPDGTRPSTTYYAFDHKGARFIVLDSALPPRVVGDPQTEWLAARLAEADGRHIFVVLYDPIHSVGWGRFAKNADAYWHPLFRHYKVRAVFSGGHRIYYRTVQDGVSYIVTGGGGALLAQVKARHNILPDDVASSYHHCIEIVVAGESIRGRAIDVAGRTRDEFILRP